MLKTILVDDNALSLALLEEFCHLSEQVQVVGAFLCAEDALAYAQAHGVEFALLDVGMPGMNGLELGRALRGINPQIILTYVSVEKDYCVDAIRMKADDFIPKPYTQEDILNGIERAAAIKAQVRPRLAVRAFGPFDVSVGDRHLHFSNAKARELLALCVDRRGGVVTMNEATGLLWPGRPVDEKAKRCYRKAVHDARHTLEKYGAEGIFESRRGYCRVIPERIACDYFDYMENRVQGQEAPLIYMPEYDWAETTLGQMSFDDDPQE